MEDLYADRPVVREGETKVLPGGTMISVQRKPTSQPPSAHQEVLQPGQTITYPDGTRVTHQVSHESVHSQTPEQHVLRPGDKVSIPGLGSISFEQQQRVTPTGQTTEQQVLRPGDKVNIPGLGSISFEQQQQVIPTSQTPEKQILRPGEKVNIPGLGSVSFEQQPSLGYQSKATSNPEKYVVRPGETIVLPDGGSLSVEKTVRQQPSPEQQQESASTIIRPGETKNIPGIGLVTVESSPINPTTNGKITIRPGEKVQLPDGGMISVVENPSHDNNNNSGIQSTSEKTLLRPGEVVDLPGFGSISLSSGTSISNIASTNGIPITQNTSTIQGELSGCDEGAVFQAGERVTLPVYSGGKIMMSSSEMNLDNNVQVDSHQMEFKPQSNISPQLNSDYNVYIDHSQNIPSVGVFNTAMRAGETRQIPGVGTVSVSRIPSSTVPQPSHHYPATIATEQTNISTIPTPLISVNDIPLNENGSSSSKENCPELFPTIKTSYDNVSVNKRETESSQKEGSPDTYPVSIINLNDKLTSGTNTEQKTETIIEHIEETIPIKEVQKVDFPSEQDMIADIEKLMESLPDPFEQESKPEKQKQPQQQQQPKLLLQQQQQSQPQQQPTQQQSHILQHLQQNQQQQQPKLPQQLLQQIQQKQQPQLDDSIETSSELSFADKMKLFKTTQQQEKQVQQLPPKMKIAPLVASKPEMIKTQPEVVQGAEYFPPPPPSMTMTMTKPKKQGVTFSDNPQFSPSPPSFPPFEFDEFNLPPPPPDNMLMDLDLPPPPPDFVFDDFMAAPKAETVQEKLKRLQIKTNVDE